MDEKIPATFQVTEASSPETKAKQAAAMKKKWADPEYRKRVEEGRKRNRVRMEELRAQKEAENQPKESRRSQP